MPPRPLLDAHVLGCFKHGPGTFEPDLAFILQYSFASPWWLPSEIGERRKAGWCIAYQGKVRSFCFQEKSKGADLGFGKNKTKGTDLILEKKGG